MTAISANTTSIDKPASKPAWMTIVAKYKNPSVAISAWQLASCYVPYIALWVLMYISLSYSYWITLALAPVAGAFLMRVFIIQHDCGHTSFFKSRKANDIVGFICGVLTFTPYEYWRTGHAMHHATSGDLDFRGFGDVETKTVKEYLASNKWQRLGYRLYRNPLVMFGPGPLYMFVINQRTPFAIKSATTKKSARGLIYTDLALLAVIIGLSLLIGFKNYLLIQLPIAWVAGSIGISLFYVQHQFDDAYWRYHPEWDYTEAALSGSSYLKLPRILQWFTGNIGLHHIHHLSPKIPNYLLERCHNENPDLQNVPMFDMRGGLKILASQLALWDEDQQKLITFKQTHDRYLKA
jgi:acyl-lipid omega-6 desaturase (Delta-12 desaturase)